MAHHSKQCVKLKIIWIFIQIAAFVACEREIHAPNERTQLCAHEQCRTVEIVNRTSCSRIDVGLRMQCKLTVRVARDSAPIALRPTLHARELNVRCKQSARDKLIESWWSSRARDNGATVYNLEFNVTYNDIEDTMLTHGDIPRVYICVANADETANEKWSHHGDNVVISLPPTSQPLDHWSGNVILTDRDVSATWPFRRKKREIHVGPVKKQSDNWAVKPAESANENIAFEEKEDRPSKTGFDDDQSPIIVGYRVESATIPPQYEEDGTVVLQENSKATIRLFGTGLSYNTMVTFTEERKEYGENCILPVMKPARIVTNSQTQHSALVVVDIPLGSGNFYFCVKNDQPNRPKSPDTPFQHQGSHQWLAIKTQRPLLPLWAAFILIVICLCFSALFSGLNLGLMSLDRTELKILTNTGTANERKYAKAIQPVRDHGNYLLCSILLGNVLVNSIFTVVLGDLTSGTVAVVGSTLMIVVFGEITPQAFCSRHGLAVGAKTIFITKAVMVITTPLAWPISKILDWILGEEIGNVYNRERLKELIKVSTDENDLDKDEVNIISGALELRKKTVKDVMTRIEDVFMLSYDSLLDFETVSEIMASGFSRIPVFDSRRTNIVTMLFIKDLAFVDPDDNTPLKTLCQFYQNPCNFVFEDTRLDVMFKIFKEGHKGHMAFVQRVNNEGEGDPFYETIGLVTLEDVIEELIQAEIMDETDVFTDNRTKRRRNEHRKQDFTVFAERRDHHRIRISPQLTLAMFQYLSTSIDVFKNENMSETILRRLLKQDIYVHVKKNKDKTDPSLVIYQQGKPIDYFVLILEGRVEVTVGKESLLFESGPFTYFGIQALTQNVGVVESPVVTGSQMGSLQSLNVESVLRHTFIPDYSVRAITDVLYVKIKRSLFLAAKRATLMERSHQRDTIMSAANGDQFDDEVEKLLYSLGEDASLGRASPLQNEINDAIQHDIKELEQRQDIQRKLNELKSQTVQPTNTSPSPNHTIFSPTSAHKYHMLQQREPKSNGNVPNGKNDEANSKQANTDGDDATCLPNIETLLVKEDADGDGESSSLLPKTKTGS